MVLRHLPVVLAHVVRDGADAGPALLVGVLGDGASQHLGQSRLALRLGLLLCRSRCVGWGAGPVALDRGERGAGGLERRGGGWASEAEDRHAAFAQVVGQWGVVAVAGDQGEHVWSNDVVEVDGVDYEREVGGVLALHRVGLLDRAEAASVQFGVPAAQGRLEPVAVGAANLNQTLLGEHSEYLIEAVQCGVVGINEERDRGRRVGHTRRLAVSVP